MKACIYKATNLINQKIYIGFDCKWPIRQKSHCREAFRPTHNAYHTIFHNAIRKYGLENFSWEVIYESLDREHTLSVMENYFIKYHNSFFKDGHGYNMSYGGQGSIGRVVSESTREKISKANKGRIASEKTLENLRKSKRGLAKTDKWKESISRNSKGVAKTEEHKYNSYLARAIEWDITYPDGTVTRELGLRRFCKLNNLSRIQIKKEKGHRGYFATRVIH